MAIRPFLGVGSGGTGGGGGFSVGPANNIFGATAGNIATTPFTLVHATSRAAAETVRNTYATANASWLAQYDANPSFGIFLFYSVSGNVVTVGQTRIGGAWVDNASTIGIQGIAGSGTDFRNITAGHIPAIGAAPDHLPFDSGMQVLPDGQLLAPKTFGVESGSIDFGDLLTLSEATGFLGINNAASGRSYRIVDFATPPNAPSNDPRIFALTEAENQFVAQPSFNTTITQDTISFNYTPTLNAQTNALMFKLASAVTNLRVRIVDTDSGVVFKYYPDKASWIGGSGTSLAAGDRSVSFADSPLVLAIGSQVTVEIRGTGLSMLGSATNVPYFAAMLQRGEFRDVAMVDKTLNDVNAGYGVSINKTNRQIPVISVPTNVGVVLSASLTITAGNADQFEESTVIFDNATGNLGVTVNIGNVPLGWSMWVGHRNAAATTATFSITVEGGGTIDGASSFSGAKNSVCRISKTSGSNFSIMLYGGSGGAEQMQSDWTQADTTSPSFIRNKPTIPASQVQSDWTQTDTTNPAFVRNKPTIPPAQVQSNWGETDTTATSFILNKPTIPTSTSQLTNNSVVTQVGAGSRIGVDVSNPRNPVVSWTAPTASVQASAFTINSANADANNGGAVMFSHTSGDLVATLTTASLPVGYSVTIGHAATAPMAGTTYTITPTTGTVNGAASFVALPNTVYSVTKTSETAWQLTSFYGDLRPAFVSASSPTAGTLRLTAFDGSTTDIPVGTSGGSGSGGRVYFFADASNTLTAAQVKTALATAESVTDWNAQSLNTLTTDYTTTAGSKYMWIAIPSAESIISAGVSLDSGTTFTGVGPWFNTFVDHNGVNYRVFVALTAVTFTASPYRFRFTTGQAVPAVTGQPSVFVFTNPVNSLTAAQVKTEMATAFSVSDWNAESQNTIPDNITTSTGTRFLYMLIPTDERITSFGVSFNSGTSFTDLTPLNGPVVDRNGINYRTYISSTSASFGGLTFRARFTTAQAVVDGVSYTGDIPEAQELLVGTGASNTAQGANISLVGGRIPNTSIGVNSVQSSSLLALHVQSEWESYRFRRIQFTGSGNHVRGINWLPNLGSSPWLNVGDWVEVMNIGGTGNYNCQIGTNNVGQTLTGALAGNGPTIGVSTTTVYRITYTGNNTTWLVSLGASGSEGGDPVPQTYWVAQSDGTGIQTSNDIDVKTGTQLLTARYSSQITSENVSINTCRFTMNNRVAGASFMKFLSNDPNFPEVMVDTSVPSINSTAATTYFNDVVLSGSYASGKTVQPDGLGSIRQFTYQSGTTMRMHLVMTDSTNIEVGATLRITAADNVLNNGDFVITAVSPQTGYINVDYTNPNASAALNAGNATYIVAATAPVMFWRTSIVTRASTQWTAACQFYLNQSFTVAAELDPNWFTVGSGHVSWLDFVYMDVVAGGGGNIHAEANITAAGTLNTLGGVHLSNRLLNNAETPNAFGQGIYYDAVGGRWRIGTVPIAGRPTTGTANNHGDSLYYDTSVNTMLVGPPRIAGLPVPQTTLNGATHQWQVLTYDGTNLSMQFPRFAGVPVSRLDTLTNADSVRYDATANTWYNSRTAGSCMARRHSTTMSVSNATDTRVQFNTGDSFLAFNSGEVGLTYDSTTNIGRFTNTSGRRVVLAVNYQVNWSTNGSGVRYTWIRVNGDNGNRVAYDGRIAASSADVTVNNGKAILALDNGQYFDVYCYQSSGTTLNIGPNAGGSYAGYGVRIQIARLNP